MVRAPNWEKTRFTKWRKWSICSKQPMRRACAGGAIRCSATRRSAWEPLQAATRPTWFPIAVLSRLTGGRFPGENEKTVRRELEQLLRKEKLAATIHDSKSAPCLPLETDWKSPLVQQFFQSVGQKKPMGVDYFCDAAVLAQAGIPSVVFGPGNIAQAHTSDEWISIRSLDQATAILLNFLKKLP